VTFCGLLSDYVVQKIVTIIMMMMDTILTFHVAIGKKFHPEHFVCDLCKKQLAVTSGTSKGPTVFKEHQGRPLCLGCHEKFKG
jgi:predicted CXXCH cytochrome family protein